MRYGSTLWRAEVIGSFNDYAVSMRPIGLRPGMPRLVVVGYKKCW